MVRMIGIVLVIWGLIAQPLMAAMPDSMELGETSSSMSMDDGDLDGAISHSDTMVVDQTSQPPCHEAAAEASAPMSCANCEGDCANGACAAACSPSTLAFMTQSLLKLERLSAAPAIEISAALVQGLSSRIFHPPKHA